MTDAHPYLTAPGGRIQVLDALRGFALFGILVANLMVFNYPIFLADPLALPELTTLDRLVEWLTRVFVEASFYPIFAFLFGLGFALQLRKGEQSVPTFRRRLAILLVIGLVHALFIWLGDILVTYALLGFALVFFRNRSTRTLTAWIGGLTFASFLTTVLSTSFGGDAIGPDLQAEVPGYLSFYSTTLLVNLVVVFAMLFNLLIHGGQILALFLLGLLAGRMNLQTLEPKHRTLLKRILVLAAGIGLPLCILYGVLLVRGPVPAVLQGVDIIIGSPLLGLSYLAGLTLLYLVFRHYPYGRLSLRSGGCP